MTNKEILKKTIEKAMENDKDFENQDCMYGFLFEDFIKTLLDRKFYYRLIFSHHFAKAFWGEKNVCSNTGLEECFCQEPNIKWVTSWKHRLSKIVLEKEPLKYLEQFLK